MRARPRRSSSLFWRALLPLSLRMSVATAANPPTPPRLLITIEGTIGAGKSTVMRALYEDYSASEGPVQFVDEPVESWINAPVNLLEAMYTGQLAHPAFQLMALATRAGPVVAALRSSRVVISERSVWSDKTVFAEIGLKDPATRAAYDLAHSSLREAMPSHLRELLILLDVPIETAVARIAQRGRPEEASIDRAYLQLLEEGHSRLAALPGVEIVRIDASKSIDDVVAAVRAVIAREVDETSPDEKCESEAGV